MRSQIPIRSPPTQDTAFSHLPGGTYFPDGADVRSFLPGSHQVTDSFALPPTVTPGEWTLAVGVTGTPGVPMLRLAIDGRDAEGWYPVSELLVK